MVDSNIISVFTQPAKGPSPGENGPECTPCMVVQLMTAIGLGTYFQLDLFKENGTINYDKHPKIWQNSVRGVGWGLIGFGMYRGYRIYKAMDKQHS